MTLSQWLCRKLPTGHVNYHHDQIEANMPELGGMALANFDKPVKFDMLVAAFRRSPFVVHQLPFIAYP